MANPQLSVELTGKIDGLRDAFNKAIQETNSFDSKTKKSLASIDKGFETLANDVDKSMSKTRGSINKASNSISQELAKAAAASATSGRAIAKGADQAAFALTNLGRVAQDAPFGFAGIQNNLNPLLESFQRLRTETGSNGAALKALGQQLIGPAGLGLALSVISSAVVLYTQYQQRSNKATQDAKKNTEEYISTLDQVRQASLKGSENAQKEITDLKLLFGAYQNANLPLKERKEAYSELQKQYPEYFGNLKFETTASDATKAAYDRLTQSILATAKARAASDLIAKNSSRQLENEQKIIDLEKERLTLQAQQAKVAKQGADELRNSTREGAGISAAVKSNDLQGKINENIKATNALKTDTNLLDQENARLVQFVNQQLLNGGKIISTNSKTTKESVDKIAEVYKTLSAELKINPLEFGATKAEIAEKNIGSYQKALEDLIKLGIDPTSDAIKKLQAAQDAIATSFKTTDLKSFVSPEIVDRTKIPTISANIVVNLKPTIEGLSELDKALKAVEERKDAFLELSNILGTSSSVISDGFSAIGEALVNGGSVIDALGKVVLDAFASFLSQLGQQSILEGLFHIAKGIAYASNPLTAALAPGEFASGGGLIAAGAILSTVGGIAKAGSANIGSNKGNNRQPVNQIPGFATGVNNFSGGLALVGERGPELVNLPTGADVIPNQRSMDILNSRQDTSVVLNGDLSVGLDQLYFALKRTEKRLERRG